MYSQNPPLKKEKVREHSAVKILSQSNKGQGDYLAATYNQNLEPIKQRAREHSAATYSQNPEPIKQRAREHSAATYSHNPEPQQKRAREYSSEPRRIKARECSQKNYIKNADPKKEMALKRYHDNRKAILTLLRNEYVKNKYSK